MTRRVNRITGQEEEQDADGFWHPVTTPSPLTTATAPAPAPAQSPQSPAPAPTSPQTRGQQLLQDVGRGVWNFGEAVGPMMPFTPQGARQMVQPQTHPTARAITDWWNAPTAQTQSAQAAPSAPPAIDFSNTGELPAPVREYLDFIQGMSSRTGAGGLPDPTPVAAPPPVTADPGLATIETAANARRDQMAQILEQERQAIAAEDPTLRNRWQRLGEFLGQLGASGDASQAGAIMSEILSRDRNMARDLRRETIRLTMMGFGYEDAATQALASRLGGEHQAAQATADRQYQHSVGQAERQDRRDIAQYEASQRGAAQAQQVQLAAAEALLNAGMANLDQHRQAVSGFARSGDPNIRAQAFGALAPESLGPEAQGAWAQQQERQMSEMGLRAFVALNAANPREVARVLRQFDPAINQRYIERVGVEAATARAVMSPRAAEAFRANPELAAYIQFMPQPAQ